MQMTGKKMGEMKMQTEEFINNANTDNHIGITDDIGVEMLEAQKQKYEDELKSYEEAVIEIVKDIKNYDDQWQIDKRLMELQSENFGLSEEKFSHKIHFLPEYWNLEQEKYAYVVRQETHKAEGYLTQKNLEKDGAEERIIIIKKNLKEVNDKLGDN